MDTLRKPLLWHGVIGVTLVAALIAQNGVILAALPVLALLAWMYLGWALLRAHMLQARAVAQPAAPDRTVPSAPPIVGAVEAPAATADRIDPDDLERYLSSRVLGQETVARQLARGVYRRMAQQNRGKPVFTALLSGPTGTGKTEMAKALADYLYGKGDSLFRVDCANVIGEAGLQTLIGSPKGFAGSSTWGSLTAHLRANPRTVLLFDEIEKAVTSPNAPMAKLLLSILDEGTCTEQSDGTRVSASEAIIILTSNAAQEHLGSVFQRYHEQPEELIRATKDTLRDHFAPEFLARIDLVTTLAPLTTEARSRIIALHAARIAETYGLEIGEIDASFVNETLRLWTTMEGYGTREIIRWIEQAVADDLIQAKESDATRVRLSWGDSGAEVQPL